MTRAEAFIIENQGLLFAVLATMCPDRVMADLALSRVEIIAMQIEEWAGEPPETTS